MKVLWVINGPISEIGKKLNIMTKDSTGWLTGYLSELRMLKDIELYITFPLTDQKEIITERVDNVTYFSFYQKPILRSLKIPSYRVGDFGKQQLKQIIEKVNPDVMHIFGSEFEHSLVAAKIYNKPSSTVVHIQGLVSVIAEHYLAGLPQKALNKFAFSSLLRGNLKAQKEKFRKRGKYEVELIRFVNHVNGRTDWDRACVERINPQIKYHFCNESLRNSFYDYHWDLNMCEEKVIFMSQATYPIKGLHFAIEALNDLKKKYPNIKLRIAGNNLINVSGLYNKLRISSYGLYIRSLIKNYNLMNNIEFTGFLSESEMVKNLLKANVFISASVIENSPNSVGEAMLIGTPVLTSDVGGVKNIFEHGVDGFSYQHDAPYMLAYYIKKVIENDDLAVEFSENAKRHALKTHNKKTNVKTLLKMYNDIGNQNKENYGVE